MTLGNRELGGGGFISLGGSFGGNPSSPEFAVLAVGGRVEWWGRARGLARGQVKPELGGGGVGIFQQISDCVFPFVDLSTKKISPKRIRRTDEGLCQLG